MFGTLQDRLPKELALAGITTVVAANRWLREVYIAAHNEQFAIDAEQEGSAFVVDTIGAWREILCIQEDRKVGNDNTVKLATAQPATATEPIAAALREGDGAGARVSGWPVGGVLGAASSGRL